MSKLLEAVNESTLRLGGTTCTVATIRAALSKAERADLDALLRDSSVAGAALARGLGKLGHRITPGALTRHRRGECACERAA